ncbi:MAG: hypothetical protein IT536_13935 [Hyphomicrobiales bacterium]|nr:hypothetical protein [Hyphomicrobiales bacterium]
MAETARAAADPHAADPHYADVAYRWRELSACAAGITAARIGLPPAPRDFLAIGDDLRLLARKVDALVEAYGAYAKANAQANAGDLDGALFDRALFNALDGNALYALEEAARALSEACAEERYYAPYRRAAAD